MAQNGCLKPTDRAAVIISGNGLKDVASAQKAVAPAPKVEPSMEALEKLLNC